jgi:YVTN family beta-propeller protein
VELNLSQLEPKALPSVLREGDHIAVNLKVSDTATGSAVRGLSPAAWMDLKGAPGVTSTDSCLSRVKQLLEGGIFSRAEADLTAYYMLVLNDDATISVVDPRFGFGDSKLLAMTPLPSPGFDWALNNSQTRLFVSSPIAGKVTVIETGAWRIIATIDLPQAGRMGVQPDGAYLWVGYNDQSGSGVAVIETSGLKQAVRIPTGKGIHDLAFSDDNRAAFVTNKDDATVSVIDIRRLAKMRDLPVGAGPVSIAFSSLSKAAYAASEKDGSISAIDALGNSVMKRIPADPGLSQVRFAPGGRLGFAVNPSNDRVYIIDAASNRIIQTAKVEKEPDQIAFTNKLAYIAHRKSDTVLMLTLDTLGTESSAISAADFSGGQHPIDRSFLPTPASGIVQASGENAVLVANPADKAVYFYSEGMAAPMGNFSNYDRSPRAVMVVERNLREHEPGIYRTEVQLRRPGNYDFALALDSPRIVQCFDFKVEENPNSPLRTGPRLNISSLNDRTTIAVNEPIELRFMVTDGKSSQPRTDLRDLAALIIAPGQWQRRTVARHLGNGVYALDFVPPANAVYYVYISSTSQSYKPTTPLLTISAQQHIAPHE